MAEAGDEQPPPHVQEENEAAGREAEKTATEMARRIKHKWVILSDIKQIQTTKELKNGHHAVVVIGYGSEGNRDFWHIRNCFGKKWGEEGYGFICRTSEIDKMWYPQVVYDAS